MIQKFLGLVIVQPTFFLTLATSMNCPRLNFCQISCQFKSDNEISVDCSNQINLKLAIDELKKKNFQEIYLFQLKNDRTFSKLEDDLLNGLKIRILDLSNNSLNTVSSRFSTSSFNSLRFLKLSGNNLTTLPNLSNFMQLETLDLSNNFLTDIFESTFTSNTHLKALNLARNRICNLSPNALTEVKASLEWLDLSGNCLPMIPATNLRNFQRLIGLNLAKNLIRGILPNLQFMNLPELKLLNVSGNNLYGFNSLTFLNVPQLEMLDFSKNHMADLENFKIQGFEKLAYLDLSGNRIHTISSFSFKDLKNVAWINLDENNVSQIETFAFSSLPKLQFLSIRQNRLEHLYKNAFDSLNVLHTLFFAQNRLKSLEAGQLSGIPDLKMLDLSQNSLEFLDPNAFIAVPRLSVLNLSKNRLENLARLTFRPLSALFWLDLSQNRLQSLESGTFETKSINILLHRNPWNCSGKKAEWLIDYLVESGVKTFFPNQQEVVCSSPVEFRGVLFKDLMIKKANETYMKTLKVAQNGPNSLPAIDLTKIPPETIRYVLNGGDIPGVDRKTVNNLIDQFKIQYGVDDRYQQNRNLNLSANGDVQTTKRLTTTTTTKMNSKLTHFENVSNSLLAIDQLPGNVILKVLAGEPLPGLTLEQTEFLKDSYLHRLSSNGAGHGHSQDDRRVSKTTSLNSNQFNAGSQIPVDFLTHLATGDPVLFGQVVQRFLQTRLNSTTQSSSSALYHSNGLNSAHFHNVDATANRIRGGSGRGQSQQKQQQTPPSITYNINELDLRSDLLLTNSKSAMGFDTGLESWGRFDEQGVALIPTGGLKLGGWYTIVGLTMTGFATLILVLVLCYRRNRRLKMEHNTDGKKFFNQKTANEMSKVTIDENHQQQQQHQPQQNSTVDLLINFRDESSPKTCHRQPEPLCPVLTSSTLGTANGQQSSRPSGVVDDASTPIWRPPASYFYDFNGGANGGGPPPGCSASSYCNNNDQQQQGTVIGGYPWYYGIPMDRHQYHQKNQQQNVHYYHTHH